MLNFRRTGLGGSQRRYVSRVVLFPGLDNVLYFQVRVSCFAKKENRNNYTTFVFECSDLYLTYMLIEYCDVNLALCRQERNRFADFLPPNRLPNSSARCRLSITPRFRSMFRMSHRGKSCETVIYPARQGRRLLSAFGFLVPGRMYYPKYEHYNSLIINI
jgi:hypothetical protein